MERHEFDLNEYSLEVKDGKAVVERKFKPGDAEDMVLRKSFGDGDVLVDSYGNIFICCVKGNTRYAHGSYVFWDKEWDELSIGFRDNVTRGVRLATDGERKFLSDRLAKEGLEWDAESSRCREKRWRAKQDEKYWVIDDLCCVVQYFEEGHSFDTSRYQVGNYFRTEETAEKAASEIRKVFEKYKEEQL